MLDVGVKDRAATKGEHAAVLAQRAGRGFAFELAEVLPAPGGPMSTATGPGPAGPVMRSPGP